MQVLKGHCLFERELEADSRQEEGSGLSLAQRAVVLVYIEKGDIREGKRCAS